MIQKSPDQAAISPYYNKSHLGNFKKINHSIVSRPWGGSVPSNIQAMGILHAPPPNFISHSYPPISILKPPLLPLPIDNHIHRAAAQGLSSPAPINNSSRARDSPSLTRKKAKSCNNRKKDIKLATKEQLESVTTPGPPHVPKNVTKCFGFKAPCDMFCGSVAFSLSPPPSSLPLPTFSLRPKLSCNVEAAGIDTATDDLRRMLRLR